ncbi:MAG TPA: polysaccharide biosynthesis/export family protein [Trinickia sp.]|nr:polysaccharide biosynthesis/export family protein [Trinickia sp.]
MKMDGRAAAGTASNTLAPAVPITEIDARVVDRLDEEARQEVLAAKALATASMHYTIGPGDVLQITVWDHPELVAANGASNQSASRPADPAKGFLVDQSGNVQFPYAGTVHVAGLRLEQAGAQLTGALSKYFRNPQVTVGIASYRSRYIHVVGAVRSPGGYPLNDIAMTLPEAISRAGGLDAAADSSRIVVNRDGATYPVNLARMLDDGQDPSRLVLAAGDILRVPGRSDAGVYVIGEVRKPLLALPRQDGRLTLSDALLQAQSIDPDTADASHLYVIRGSPGAAPQVFRLDARSPVSMLLANQFELRPKDVVYVDSGDLVRFSRVLKLMLPGFSAGAAASFVTD